MNTNDSSFKKQWVKLASVCTILVAVVKGVAWSRLMYVHTIAVVKDMP